MIFDEQTRKLWPPTKTDYQVGDRVKIIDQADEFSPLGFLGMVGTVTAVWTGAEADSPQVGETPEEPFFTVTVDGPSTDGFWPEELRPAHPYEVSAPIPVDADLTSLGVKGALLGVFRPGKQ